ncbi:hypothetical protein [Flavobacterium kingsejongi]|uniref:Glycosyltransferase n=1 Tax=Flavobacterium kingsejongi TaxID=1678728 RepID=A0A2S1LQB7_9FLAO|nr:hypothetical protein [Flavobacterium kingsejongi]AWG25934.1 hypothetical protein FK004_12230 [Flavobacterium kingsejongi]
MKKIHVGFLLSYDYDKIKLSLPPVYKDADRIFIAMDQELRTWTGNKFEVDPSFFEWIKAFDVDHKIEFYSDNFFVPELTAIENDTRERHLLSLKMGIGNWLIQVDSDEYFIDFGKYVRDLKKHDHFLDHPERNPVQISGFHLDVYKYLDDGLLYVKNASKVLLATNYPNYKYARQSKERIIYTDNLVLHESLARTEADLRYKLKNWGHNDELNKTFLEKWLKADKHNYHEIKDVFYLDATQWKELGYLPTKNIQELKQHFNEIDCVNVTQVFLWKKNFGQWFKHLKVFKMGKKPFFNPNFKIK